MILNALDHADECLFYLAGLREQSVFNFCAIPQSMAIATLELCFQNYSMFERNIKITKGQACQLMLESTQNLQLVCEVFKKHVKSIRKKNRPQDPNFLKISIACGKIDQFVESIFPTHKVEDAIAKSKLTAQQAAEQERLKRGQPETTDGNLWLFVAVFVALAFISGIMVSPRHLLRPLLLTFVSSSLLIYLVPASTLLWVICSQSSKASGCSKEALAKPSSIHCNARQSYRALHHRFGEHCVHTHLYSIISEIENRKK
jgi:hypothetical protein